MASRGMPLDTAAIFSTVMEGILYGFSVLMFGGTMWALTHRRRMKEINRINTAVAFMLLILSTAHMIVDIIRIEEGLVTYRDTFPGGPAAFFADVTQITFVVKNIIYTMQTMLGDGMVIYRCYIVWQSVWVIIVPSCLWLGITVCGICAVYSVSKATNQAGNIFAKATGQWITAFYAMTLASNLLASGFLAYRIWKMERDISAVRTSNNSMMPIVRVLADAAILYSVTLLSALVCFVEGNNGQYVVLDMIMPIISIAFYMIIIRMAMKTTSYGHISTARMGSNETARETPQQYHMMRMPVEVHISQITHQDETSKSTY
ncbi:uncharacterized protein F5891DRAFT_1144498 [Suillus fuscotomentosus]|uniref:Uncharacterized protein n=1 Tax=Suillus fuscotomentosus TaxID=1912939 RepID=A0AAD4E8I5_9AGAM|nr:uncharacterized protein F5891DRAFT_1148029 [Suillus fuscotomentosus]XP_041227219.1 uncharacterized protein F5891DRAFT_1144498 [Suillus fuscotomentosus]KAG1898785.1 hypothetical protein F5891DRAFT_1148029 [Suillus fuscotomentosus]KAG1901644.1 hypothetical protein F5891DRAFT_1144498 [Suillus fuscotomentosus]